MKDFREDNVAITRIQDQSNLRQTAQHQIEEGYRSHGNMVPFFVSVSVYQSFILSCGRLPEFPFPVSVAVYQSLVLSSKRIQRDPTMDLSGLVEFYGFGDIANAPNSQEDQLNTSFATSLGLFRTQSGTANNNSDVLRMLF